MRIGARAKRWVEKKQRNIPTSPALLEYQKNMRGIDLVDQCREEYTAQLHSKKWWHKILLFGLDSSIGNSYILYQEHCLANEVRPMSRLMYHYRVAMYLTTPGMRLGRTAGSFNVQPNGFHMPEDTGKKRGECLVCTRKQNQVCNACGGAYMCRKKCYKLIHTNPYWASKVRC